MVTRLVAHAGSRSGGGGERREALRAVDLFAGWGGFTLAAIQAGLDVVWAANHWQVAVDTHAANHPHTVHACQDLRQADFTRLPAFDVLLASPACQGHSTASQPRRRAHHDALRATAFAVIDCADACQPAAIVVENVPSFTRWRLYPWWCEGLERLGYHLDVRYLTASRLGVPQRRTRLFVVATRDAVRVGDIALDDVEEPIGPHLEDIPQRSPLWRKVGDAGEGVRSRVQAGRRRHGSRFLTQHVTGHPGVGLHEPIRTVTTAPSHWNLVEGGRYRALTGRELARAMGFPDSYTWDPSLPVAAVTKGLGNAVCPPVARRLLERVVDAVG